MQGGSQAGDMQMREVKMNFSGRGQQPVGFARRVHYQQTQAGPYDLDNSKRQRRNFAANKNVFSSSCLMGQSEIPSVLPLGKAQQVYVDASSPITKSTVDSSNDGGSVFDMEDEGMMDLDMPFDASPIGTPMAHKHASMRTITV